MYLKLSSPLRSKLTFAQIDGLVIALLKEGKRNVGLGDRVSLGIGLRRIRREDLMPEQIASCRLSITEEGLLTYLDGSNKRLPTPAAFGQRLAYAGIAELELDVLDFQKNIIAQLITNTSRLKLKSPLADITKYLAQRYAVSLDQITSHPHNQ